MSSVMTFIIIWLQRLLKDKKIIPYFISQNMTYLEAKNTGALYVHLDTAYFSMHPAMGSAHYRWSDQEITFH